VSIPFPTVATVRVKIALKLFNNTGIYSWLLADYACKDGDLVSPEKPLALKLSKSVKVSDAGLTKQRL
jgi:hypothetical protein